MGRLVMEEGARLRLAARMHRQSAIMSVPYYYRVMKGTLSLVTYAEKEGTPMLKYITKRLLIAVLQLFVVATVVFLILQIMLNYLYSYFLSIQI